MNLRTTEFKKIGEIGKSRQSIRLKVEYWGTVKV